VPLHVGKMNEGGCAPFAELLQCNRTSASRVKPGLAQWFLESASGSGSSSSSVSSVLPRPRAMNASAMIFYRPFAVPQDGYGGVGCDGVRCSELRSLRWSNAVLDPWNGLQPATRSATVRAAPIT